MTRLTLRLASFAFVSLTSCSGSDQFAPVSGVVRLGAKPVVGASVSFEPVTNGKSFGPGSHAITDKAGQYTLNVSMQSQRGALIGKHVVRISLPEAPKGDPGGAHLTRELLPARYNSRSELTFDVQPGGTSSAHFDLKEK